LKKKLQILIVLFIFILLGYKIYRNIFYLKFVNKIELEKTGQVFALYKNEVFFLTEVDYFVLLFRKNEQPQYMNFKTPVRNSANYSYWYNKLMKNLVFENYETDMSKAKDPKISLLKKKFLVLERSGLYFGLYDIEKIS